MRYKTGQFWFVFLAYLLRALTHFLYPARLPPGFHQQSRVRDAKSHVPRPLGGDARVHIENREYGGHLRDEKDISLSFLRFKSRAKSFIKEENIKRPLTSRYINEQPRSVIDRNIGEATLNTFSLRCLYTYIIRTMVPKAQKIDTASSVILEEQRTSERRVMTS